MAFSEVKLAHRTGNATQQVDTYHVESDTPWPTVADIASASDGTTSIPAYWTWLGSWAVVDKSVGPMNGSRTPYHFEVQVTYATPPGNSVPTAGGKFGVRVNINGQEWLENVSKDRDGKPIKNPVGDPFVPGPERLRYDEIITITWQSDTVDIASLAAARGKINSDTFTLTANGYTKTFNPNEVKVGNIAYETTLGVDGQNYWIVQVPLIYRADTWKAKIVNKGYRMYVNGSSSSSSGGTGNLSEWLDQEVYLASNGTQLAAGANVTTTDVWLDDQVVVASLFTGIS